LNPAAFQLPLAFQYGNVPRESANIRAEGILNSDISALKMFTFNTTWRLQFRVEGFNVFNRVQFGTPGKVFNSTTFGQIGSQANLPRQIQLALKLFW
jgi:hypothetical protein